MQVQNSFKIIFFKQGYTEYLFFGGNPLNHTPPSQNHGPWLLAKTSTLAARDKQGAQATTPFANQPPVFQMEIYEKALYRIFPFNFLRFLMLNLKPKPLSKGQFFTNEPCGRKSD